MDNATTKSIITTENSFDDYYLSKYKIHEDKGKIIFEIPVEVNIDMVSNKDKLLTLFKEVEVNFSADRRHIKTVTCFKKQYS